MCKEFTIIAGPCSVESEEQIMKTASELKDSVLPDFFRVQTS
jgi:3-deoxy-D-arabino-heptulosonate 7-phosphate (DAHP) synthase